MRTSKFKGRPNLLVDVMNSYSKSTSSQIIKNTHTVTRAGSYQKEKEKTVLGLPGSYSIRRMTSLADFCYACVNTLARDYNVIQAEGYTNHSNFTPVAKVSVICQMYHKTNIIINYRSIIVQRRPSIRFL